MSTELVKATLWKGRDTFALALGGSKEGAEKYILGVYNTVILNQDLIACTPESIRDAAITSAVLGVAIDAKQHAYLVPYGNKAQFQMSYKGYVSVAKRDPDVDHISSNIVYEGDTFRIDIGANTLSHMPDLESERYGKEGNIKYVYAIVRFKKNTGRDIIFEVMTKDQIDKIKNEAKQKHIWNKHYGEMARKTVIKRLCKHAQLGDVARLDEIDNSIEQGKIINVTPQGEVQVDDFLLKERDNILALIHKAETQEQLDKIFQENSVKLEELTSNNLVGEISKLSKEKKEILYAESVARFLDKCEDIEGLDKVYNAHSVRINQLKAAIRNEVTEHYCDLKQTLMDIAA